LRIIYIISNASLNPNKNTGYARHIQATIFGLKELGHEIEIWHRTKGRISLDEQKYTHENPAENGGLIKRALKWIVPEVLWESFKDFLYLRGEGEFVNRVRKGSQYSNPDLIYERSSYLSTSGLKLAKSYGVPFTLEVNSPFAEQRRKLSGRSWFHDRGVAIEKMNAREADAVFTVSGALKDFLIKSFEVNPNKVLSNPNGVSMPTHELKKINRSDLFSKNPTFTIIGFVGSIMPYHGLELLIEAFNSALRLKADLYLLIVGDGSQTRELKARCQQLGIEANVLFTGSIPQEDVFSYIDEMDICVMPNSNWYGSPIKIFEYALRGKAVIAPDVSPVREVMEGELDGLIVQPNVQSLCESILKLVRNPEMRDKLGMSFRKKVLESYTWKENTLRINQVIGSL
jgi:glycosyltransferase involved in cell wall biosynthesis